MGLDYHYNILFTNLRMGKGEASSMISIKTRLSNLQQLQPVRLEPVSVRLTSSATKSALKIACEFVPRLGGAKVCILNLIRAASILHV